MNEKIVGRRIFSNDQIKSNTSTKKKKTKKEKIKIIFKSNYFFLRTILE